MKPINLVVPPYLFNGVKDRSSHTKAVITRIALTDFNRVAYEKARLVDTSQRITTSFLLNEVGVKCLVAYQEKHGLSSRNQAVLAILATHHAKQAAVEKKPIPSFSAAFAMIRARG